MTSKTTNIPFPPGGTQITTGPGTLTGIAAQVPRSYHQREDGNDPTMFPMDAVVYDSATGKLDLSTPILSVRGTQDPGALNIAFTKGLYVTQNTASSLSVTYQ